MTDADADASHARRKREEPRTPKTEKPLEPCTTVPSKFIPSGDINWDKEMLRQRARSEVSCKSSYSLGIDISIRVAGERGRVERKINPDVARAVLQMIEGDFHISDGSSSKHRVKALRGALADILKSSDLLGEKNACSLNEDLKKLATLDSDECKTEEETRQELTKITQEAESHLREAFKETLTIKKQEAKTYWNPGIVVPEPKSLNLPKETPQSLPSLELKRAIFRIIEAWVKDDRSSQHKDFFEELRKACLEYAASKVEEQKVKNCEEELQEKQDHLAEIASEIQQYLLEKYPDARLAFTPARLQDLGGFTSTQFMTSEDLAVILRDVEEQRVSSAKSWGAEG